MSKVKAGKIEKAKADKKKLLLLEKPDKAAALSSAGTSERVVPSAKADKIVADREKIAKPAAVDLSKMPEADVLKMSKGLKADAEAKGEAQDLKKQLPPGSGKSDSEVKSSVMKSSQQQAVSAEEQEKAGAEVKVELAEET